MYRVRHPAGADPRRSRVFVIVARQAVINSRFSSVICAPVYSTYHGLSSQISVGVDQGLKHDSAIHWDELVSLPKRVLTDYIGSLPPAKIAELNHALLVALELHISESAG
jgi:mRNA interferase MazF